MSQGIFAAEEAASSHFRRDAVFVGHVPEKGFKMVRLNVYEPVTAIPARPQYAQTKHTHECLARRLQELAPSLYHCFPAYAADCGLDAARSAGMNYIRRVQEGTACDLVDGQAYLRLIAFRAARRRQREESSTVPIWFDVAAPQIQGEGPVERYADLRGAVASLPRRQRQAVSLHFLERLSVRKTASEMGISPRAVSRYIERGVSNLRKALSEKKLNRAGAVAS